MAFRTMRTKDSPETANVTDKLASDSEELHVLAVDDSLVDRKVIERLLKISSCKVTAVESGSRALQYLGLDGEQSSVGSFDGLKVNLIMTDYSMPGMTGYELLKKLKTSSMLRKIPVVIMSSENIMARIDRCLEEGAEDFLVKPVKLSDVLRLKECILKGEGDNKEIQMHKRMLNDDPSSVLPPARRLIDDPSSVRPPARKLNDDPSSVRPPARKLNDDPPSVLPPPARKLNDVQSSVPPPARKLKDDLLSMLPPASSLLPLNNVPSSVPPPARKLKDDLLSMLPLASSSLSSRLACDLSPSILPCPSSSSPQSLSKRPRL